jgi:hypothetical protein
VEIIWFGVPRDWPWWGPRGSRGAPLGVPARAPVGADRQAPWAYLRLIPGLTIAPCEPMGRPHQLPVRGPTWTSTDAQHRLGDRLARPCTARPPSAPRVRCTGHPQIHINQPQFPRSASTSTVEAARRPTCPPSWPTDPPSEIVNVEQSDPTRPKSP